MKTDIYIENVNLFRFRCPGCGDCHEHSMTGSGGSNFSEAIRAFRDRHAKCLEEVDATIAAYEAQKAGDWR